MHISWDNPVLQKLAWYFDLVWCVLLWLICCLPVVTFGASTTAMWAELMAIADGRADSSVTVGFLRRVKAEFRQGTKLGLLYLAAVLAMAGDGYACLQMRSGAAAALMWSVTGILAVAVLCFGSYCFAVLARFEVNGRQLLANCVQLCARHPGSTVLLLLLWGLCALAIWMMGFFAILICGPLLYLGAKRLNKLFAPDVERLEQEKFGALDKTEP